MTEMSGQDAKVTSFAERTLQRRLELEAIDDRFRKRFIWQAAIGGFILLLIGVLAYRSWYVTDDEPDEALVAAVDELRGQVEGLGAEPVVPPAEDIVEDAPEVISIPGPEGPQGDRGPRGEQGPQGSPCQPGNPNCVGPPGPIGATGAAGPIGATGEGGPEGPVGATGAEGPVGATGSEGPSGPQGDPGPAGRGIDDVQVVEVAPNECHLIVTFTDGTQDDAGAVDCPTPPLLPGG